MFPPVDEPGMSIHVTPGEGLPRFRLRHLQDADDAAASGHGQGGQIVGSPMVFHAVPMNIHEQ